MSWKPVQPAGAAQGWRPGTVGVSLTKIRSSWRCRVKIAPDVIARLNWKDGAGLDVAHGEGEHAGMIRLAPSTGAHAFKLNAKTTTNLGHAKRASLSFGALDEWEWTHQIERYCEFYIEGGALVITLPTWARPKLKVEPPTSVRTRVVSSS